MGIRFVTPETIKLSLKDGDSIQIKKRLSHGERDAMFARMRDGKHVRSAELAAYLVGWSASVPYSLEMSEDERIDILNGLDPDSYDEIRDALRGHLDAQQEKKLPTIAPASSAISTLPDDVTGGTSGFEPSQAMSLMSS